MPSGMSNLPWRKAGVKYTRNEILFDIVEEMDAIVDSTGKAVSCEAHGTIHANSHLSGTTMTYSGALLEISRVSSNMCFFFVY
jgi:hypothetical protein